MKKVFLSSIFIMFLFSIIPLTLFADSWPDEGQDVEVNKESPFDNSSIFDSESISEEDDYLTVDETQTSNQEDVQEQIISPIDSEMQEITNKRAPIFDDSVREIGEIDYTDVSKLLPDVSIDDAVEWGQRKTYEIIQLMQTFVQPICIICFIISAFMFLFGTIASNNWAGRGLMGIFMSSIVYALVMFAPVIVQTFTAWVST